MTFSLYSEKKIEVVIINWKRPANVSQIVESIRNQTIKCTITVCDCHPEEQYALDDFTKQNIDRLYRWEHNHGAYSRYLPLASFDHKYTFFIDDDMLPGNKCLEHYLECATKQPNFGVLGQMGRIIDEDGAYRPKDVPLKNSFIEVDIVVRAYFVETKYLYNIVKLRWFLNYFYDRLPEDDILLCASLKLLENKNCYLIPFTGDRETLVNKLEMSDRFALCHRPDHYYKRSNLINYLLNSGWIPIKMRK